MTILPIPEGDITVNTADYVLCKSETPPSGGPRRSPTTDLCGVQSGGGDGEETPLHHRDDEETRKRRVVAAHLAARLELRTCDLLGKYYRRNHL